MLIQMRAGPLSKSTCTAAFEFLCVGALQSLSPAGLSAATGKPRRTSASGRVRSIHEVRWRKQEFAAFLRGSSNSNTIQAFCHTLNITLTMASLHINAPPGTPLVSPSRVNVTPYPNRYPTAATPYALDGQGAAAVGYTYTPKTVGSGPMSTATPKTGYAPGTPLPAGVAVVVPASSVPHRVEKHPERQRKMGAEVVGTSLQRQPL